MTSASPIHKNKNHLSLTVEIVVWFSSSQFVKEKHDFAYKRKQVSVGAEMKGRASFLHDPIFGIQTCKGAWVQWPWNHLFHHYYTLEGAGGTITINHWNSPILD